MNVDTVQAQESIEARRLRSVLEALEAHRAEWFVPVLLTLVRDGLDSLRNYLEDPDETDITWANPAVELHWPIEWDWARWDEGVTWAGPEPEDFLRAAESGGPEKAAEDLLKFVALNVLQTVVSWASTGEDEGAVFGYLLENGRLRTLIPAALGNELALEAMSEDERGRPWRTSSARSRSTGRALTAWTPPSRKRSPRISSGTRSRRAGKMGPESRRIKS